MNKFDKNQEKIYEIWKQSQTEVSRETSKKSLSAFQEGLKDAEGEHKKRRKIHKPRRKLPGIIGGTAVAGLTFLLIFNTGILNTNKESATEEQEKVIPEEIEEENIAEELMEKALNRPSYDYETLDMMYPLKIFNDNFDVYIPRDWRVFETKESGDTYIQMTGEDNEKMKLILFEEQDVEEVMKNRIDELTKQFEATEEITIPIETLIDEMNVERQYRSYYEAIFPFELENMEIRVFYNEDTKQVMELYVSKLFGYPIIFTSEFNIGVDESWNNSIIFFTRMNPLGGEEDVHGSIGELDPVHQRPTEKEVMLNIGAAGVEQVEVELYDNEELGLTSYITKTMEVERIEFEEFIEWRFTEPDVPEGSFIAIGNLNEDFPMNNKAEVLFTANEIDMSFYEDIEPDIPGTNTISYQDSDNYLSGNFDLFEVDGKWYYSRHHGDFSIYNGGTYYQRLSLLVRSIEWY